MHNDFNRERNDGECKMDYNVSTYALFVERTERCFRQCGCQWSIHPAQNHTCKETDTFT